VTDADATVVLVRHGRTALNAAGALRGRLDPPLDVVGQAEAQALAAVSVDWEIALVVTSPLTRALQTAAPIAAARRTHLEVDPDLADRDYGECAGLSLAEVAARFGSLDAAPGVEPIDRFTSRALEAVLSAAWLSAPAPVVVVAHDAVNRAVLARLVPSLGDAADLAQHTGCWNRLERRGMSWSAPLVNVLPGLVGTDGP
jgi:broad specificity phosphatase PhoE